jgi:hypothetical protein
MKPHKRDIALKPFLINKDDEGHVRLTVRETRYNSQGYPLVTARMVEQTFKTATAARAHAAEEYRAKAGEFASR